MFSLIRNKRCLYVFCACFIPLSNAYAAQVVFEKTTVFTSEDPILPSSVQVYLDTVPQKPVVVSVSSLNDAEIMVENTPLFFDNTNWNQPQTVHLIGVDDEFADGPQPVSIEALVSTTDTRFSSGYVLVGDWYNLDNEPAALISRIPSNKAVNEGDVFSFTLQLNQEPQQTVSIDILNSATSEVSVLPSRVEITKDNWLTPFEIRIQAIQDNRFDGTKTARISTQGTVSSDTRFNGLFFEQFTLSVRDTTKAQFVLQKQEPLRTEEGGEPYSFYVSLNAAPSSSVSVQVSVSDPQEASLLTSRLLTFTPSQYQQPQTITLQGLDDKVYDGDKAYDVVLSVVQGSDSKYSQVSEKLTFSSIDKLRPGFNVSLDGKRTQENSANPVNISVSLSSKPSSDVFVQLSSNQPSEVSLSSYAVSFSASNWNKPVLVSVYGVDDEKDDGDQHYVIRGVAQSADAEYSNLSFETEELTNDDDDASAVVASKQEFYVEENNSIHSFRVYLTSEPFVSASFSVVSNTSDLNVLTPYIFFNGSNWKSGVEVSFVSQEDMYVDGNRPFSLTLHADASSDATYSALEDVVLHGVQYDNDHASWLLSKDTSYSIQEGGRSSYVDVQLTAKPMFPVRWNVSPCSTEQVHVYPSLGVFEGDDWNTPVRISIQAIDDHDVESTLLCVVELMAHSEDPSFDGLSVSPSMFWEVESDDVASLVFEKASYMMQEGSEDVWVKASLTASPKEDVVLSLKHAFEENTVFSHSTWTFKKGVWPQETLLKGHALEDDYADGTLDFEVSSSLNSSDLDFNGMTSSFHVTRHDNDKAFVRVSSQDTTSSESGESASVSVVLGSKPRHVVHVVLQSSDEKEGVVENASLDISPEEWNVSRNVSIKGQDDDVIDGYVPYSISSYVVSEDMYYNGLSGSDVGCVNEDNDSAFFKVSSQNVLNTSEDGEMDTFSVALSARPSSDVVVYLDVSDKKEVSLVPDRLVFTPEQYNVSQNVVVQGLDDKKVDVDTPYLVFSRAVETMDTHFSQASFSLSGVNKDNDSASVLVDMIEDGFYQTSEKGDSITYHISLSSEPSSDVMIHWGTDNIQEGKVVSEDMVFTKDTWFVPQVLLVQGVDDFVDDGDVYYAVQGTTSSEDALYHVAWIEPLDLMNEDDDTASLSFKQASDFFTYENGRLWESGISLGSKPVFPVTIKISVSNEKEALIVSGGELVFTPENWETEQVFAIKGIDDFVDDGDQNYRVYFDIGSEDSVYRSYVANPYNMVNKDDDTAAINVSVGPLETSESGGFSYMDVKLDSEPVDQVRVSFFSDNLAEGFVENNVLVFDAHNWKDVQRVKIVGVDDAVDDGNVSYHVSYRSSSESDTLYNNLEKSWEFTNTNNDKASVSVVQNQSVTSENGDNASFTVVLNSQPLSDVSFALKVSNEQEAMVMPGSLYFTPLDWNKPKTITVLGVDDDVDDADISYTVSFEYLLSDKLYNAENLPVLPLSFVNIDNDTALIKAVAESVLVTSEDRSQKVALSVSFASKPMDDVWVHASTSNPFEGVPEQESFLIRKENWNKKTTLNIYGVDDDFDDGDKPYQLFLSFESSDPLYSMPVVSDITFDLVNKDDDSASFLAYREGPDYTDEKGAFSSIKARIGAKPYGVVSVRFEVSNNSEALIASQNVRFDANNYKTYQTIRVQGVDDSFVDGDVAYHVKAFASSTDTRDANIVESVYAWFMPFMNKDDDVAGVKVVYDASQKTTEEGGEAHAYVSLTSKPYQSVMVRVSSSNEKEGALDQQALWFDASNWNNPKKLTAKGQDDIYDDGDVAYRVDFSIASGDKDYNSSIRIPSWNLVNTNNDKASLMVSSTGLQTTEQGGAVSVTLRLSTPPMSDLAVSLQVSDASEAAVLGVQNVVFSESDWNTSKVMVVKGADDFYVDGDVAYRVSFVGSSLDARYAGVVNGTPALEMKNIDNDEAGLLLSLSSGSPSSTDEKGKTVSYDVSLKAQPMYPVVLRMSVSDASEALALNPSVTFQPSQWNVVQKVVFKGVNDNVDDGDQRVSVSVVADTQDSVFKGIGSGAGISFTNQDDDESRVVVGVSSPSTVYTTEAGSSVTYPLTLSSEPTQNVVFDVSSTVTTEAVVSPSRVVFTPSDWNVSHVVTVKGVDDDYDDGDVAYVVKHAFVSGDSTYTASSVSIPDKNFVNKDNDTAGVEVLPVVSKEVSENGSTQTVSIKLLARPRQPVSVAWTSSNNAEGSVAPATLVFADVSSSGWKTPKTITVRGVDDDVVDGDQSFFIRYQTTSQDTSFNNFAANVVGFVNKDNDIPGVKISTPVPPYTTNTGGETSFTVVLTKGSVANVSVSLRSSDTSLGTVDKPSVMFSPSNWNVPQTVKVKGVRSNWMAIDLSYSIVTGNTASSSAAYNNVDVADVLLQHLKRLNTSIAAGHLHTCYTSQSKEAYCWGSHAFYQLGNDNTANHERRPMTVDVDNVWGDSWNDIAAGSRHTCALDNMAQIYCWGTGTSGQLGYADNENGSMYSDMKTPRFPVAWPEGKKAWGWIDVGVGRNHTCAIAENQTMWCFGSGFWGQRGDGDARAVRQGVPTQVDGPLYWKQVSTGGADHTCAITVDGALYCFGNNGLGAAGADPKTRFRVYTPLRVGTDTDWQYVATGGIYRPDPDDAQGSITSQNTCAVKKDGTLWCWGSRGTAFMGGSRSGYEFEPVQIGEDTDWVRVEMSGGAVFAMKRNRTLWSWGLRNPELLGRTPNEQSPYDLPGKVTVGGGSTLWSDYSVGATHACALNSLGKLYCFGSNSVGQLGLNAPDSATAGVVSVPY